MFPERLRKLRLEAGLTQKELAIAINTSQQNIGFYELGKRNPKKEILTNLSIYFNVSIEYLEGKSNKKSPEPYSKSEMHFRKAVSDLNMTKEQEEQFQKDIINFIEQRKNILKEDK